MSRNEMHWANYRKLREVMAATPKEERAEKIEWFRCFQRFGLHAPVIRLFQQQNILEVTK